VLGIAGIIDGASSIASAACVILFAAVFAVGETLLSPTLPTMVNALATDELRGRYNALSGMMWGVSGVIAPISAGPLLQLGLGGVWIGLVIAGCLGASLIALSLRRLITAHQDGTVPDPEPTGNALTEVAQPDAATQATAEVLQGRAPQAPAEALQARAPQAPAEALQARAPQAPTDTTHARAAQAPSDTAQARAASDTAPTEVVHTASA
jgi:hypothetical protein